MNNRFPIVPADVVLVTMPFGSLYNPSIALSLLQAELAEQLGLRVAVRHYTLLFAKDIGEDAYANLAHPTSSTYQHAIGEWVFSHAVFEQTREDGERYVEDILRSPAPELFPFLFSVPESIIARAQRVRSKVDAFLDVCAEDVTACRPRVVGFSCVFEQKVASLALAKRIKAAAPDTVVVFGGPTCEGVPGSELVRQFPFVDAVVSGEGDVVFPRLVNRALRDEPLAGLPGVYARGGPKAARSSGRCPNAPVVRDMARLPFVSYDDYFEQLEALGLDLRKGMTLFVEGSRGCWWGERNRCTFCCFGGRDVEYRTKPADRLLAELRHVAGRYSGYPITLTDNVVDGRFYDRVLPELAADPLGVELACDVRPTLSRGQVRALRDAEFTMIEPGIESLSTPVLKLMRKGVSALQNIQLLKWCKEYGIHPHWNILWGFPGEPPEEYVRMALQVPLLAHLHPPEAVGRISVLRHSPCFEEARQLGVVDLSPSPAYAHIYPPGKDAAARLATFFTFGYRGTQNPEKYTGALVQAVRAWKADYAASELFSADDGHCLHIWDERPCARQPLTTLQGAARTLYLAADQSRSLSYLRRMAGGSGNGRDAPKGVAALLRRLVAQGLMIRDGNRYLSLAIPLGAYRPRPAALRRFHQYLRSARQLARQEAVLARTVVTEVLPGAQVASAELEEAFRALAPAGRRRTRDGPEY